MKIKKILIIILTAIGIIGSISTIGFLQNRNISINKNINKNNNVAVVVKGNVKFPDTYYVEKGIKIKDVLNIANLLNDSDISNIELEKQIYLNETIYVKKTNNLNVGRESKIYLNDLINNQNIYIKGISSNIIKEIQKIVNINKIITWDEIQNIKGVGPKTLAKLKNILVL
ncbi:Uncharacterised protein [Mycoplasmopsis maculosa]|uniref:ComE operon protein 1 n=1 Tax=Mycoplasmopsis maculosa TaxID=114885 RepID=A0A449B510_9BACT|nr:hypothetical protein [Mycoplasmopsis maculosa]VEU75680.1 Uncharacterised protein [Mycoplasmopsis maculosa]